MSFVSVPFITFIVSRSFRESVYVVGLFVAAVAVCVFVGIGAAFLAVYHCIRILQRWRRHRRGRRERRERRSSTRYEERTGLLRWELSIEAEEGEAPQEHKDEGGKEEEEEEAEEKEHRTEEEEQVRKGKRMNWRVCKIAGWLCIITIGLIPLWSVVMDYMALWAGLLVALAFYWSCWFLFFPFAAAEAPSSPLERTECGNERENENESGTFAKCMRTRYHFASTTDGCGRGGNIARCVAGGICGCLQDRIHRVRTRPFLFAFGLFLFLMLSLLFAVPGEGLCISEYPFRMTTRMSRHFDSSSCSGIAPCHVYLTLGRQVDSQMRVHFHYDHSGYQSKLPPVSVVYYDTVSHADARNKSLSDLYRYSAQGIPAVYETQDMKRILHAVLLSNLSSDTVYYFRAGYGIEQSRFSPEKRFLSGPSGVEDEYRFVNGGDMGVSDATTKLSRIAASLNPHFAIIGGDIAYANAMETCYRRWDEWFDAWEQNMVTTEGNYVPMITAIGNHESGGHMPYIDPASIPFYFRYFALANSEGQDIAEASGFSTKGLAYKAYYIGENTMFVGLDSDMATRVAGEQTEWLEDTLQDFWNTHHQSAREASNYTVRAMAFYHQPMWPSDKESGGITGMLQDNWGSVFAKYNVSVALEHHSHRYGRTVMRDKQKDANGTLHIGGGGWGVPPASNNCPSPLEGCHSGTPWYMDKVVFRQHILHVHMLPHSVKVEAIDIEGKTFDMAEKML